MTSYQSGVSYTDTLLYALAEICVQKVNELSKYQMVWTDDDGFLLKPLGTSSIWFCSFLIIMQYEAVILSLVSRARKIDDKVLSEV